MFQFLVSTVVVIFILTSCSLESTNKLNSSKSNENKVSNVLISTSITAGVEITE